jgi:hypothetical protein
MGHAQTDPDPVVGIGVERVCWHEEGSRRARD